VSSYTILLYKKTLDAGLNIIALGWDGVFGRPRLGRIHV
jgi:hypothetical protein